MRTGQKPEHPPRRQALREAGSEGESGFMLLAVVVMVALVLIALSVAVPVVARQLQRDKEVESEHRAEQYVRAIRLYYAKNKSYPPSMDALEKSNNIRYLRQRYVDPLTGKSDWRLIHNPQTKTRFPFGEELSGLTPMGAGLGSASGLASGAGGTSGTSINTGCSAANSAFCDQATTTSTSGGASGSTGSTGSTGSSGETGMFGDSSGGVIYGVGTSKTGDSILNPNQQTTYETWEFWYDPQLELLRQKANVMGGGGMGSSSASGFGQDANGFGANGASGATGNTGSTGFTQSPTQGPGQNTGSFGGGFGPSSSPQ